MRYTGLILAAGLLAAGVISGCNEPAAPTSGGSSSGSPSGSSASSASTVASSTPPKVEIKYNEKDLAALEKRLAATPDDAKLKEETAEAAFQVGYQIEYDDAISPRVKYRTALKHFRRALALKPDHAQAAAEKKQIEDIYTSMGRPIPD